MSVTTTDRLLMSKPDNAELVSVALLNANWDKADAEFIPCAMMKANVSQTFTTGVEAVVAYNVVEYDSYAARPEGAMANLSTDTITIRKTGLYLVHTKINWTANATGTRRLGIAKAGTNQAAIAIPGSSAGSHGQELHEILPFAANDTITSRAIQTSGGNLDAVLNTFVDNISMAVIWLGSTS